MSQQEYLTNERLLKLFDNQFELVNYAIKIAVRMIEGGFEPTTRQGYARYNLATQILHRIESGKERYKNIQSEEELINTLKVDLLNGERAVKI